MLKTKEGKEISCGLCGKPVDDHLFWSVMRYEKEIPTFPCKKCGKPISIEFDPARDSYEMVKNCRCKERMIITSELIENLRGKPKWDRKTYVFCEKCFRKSFASPVFYAELGEDQKNA